VNRRIPLPPQVAAIYCAVEELEALYPGRKFTPDGHLVGSIGEVTYMQNRYVITLMIEKIAEDHNKGSR
jgi:hypothetical protein